MIELLSQSDSWAVDGTFKSSPKGFKQCFIIGAMVKVHKIIIAAHALLPGKNKRFYEEAFRAINEKLGPNKPKKSEFSLVKKKLNLKMFAVISDFEQGIVQAARRVFDGVECTGCFFHFTQALFKKLKALKLDTLYGRQNNDNALAVRMTFRFAILFNY